MDINVSLLTFSILALAIAQYLFFRNATKQLEALRKNAQTAQEQLKVHQEMLGRLRLLYSTRSLDCSTARDQTDDTNKPE